MDRIIVVPDSMAKEVIDALTVAGYKIKKPKLKHKLTKLKVGNGIFNQIKQNYPIYQREKVEQEDTERRNVVK